MQIINILKAFKDFFSCKIVLDANHQYPEIIQRFFRWQIFLRRKSALSWKNSKTFSPAKLSTTQITNILKIFKDFFTCNIVLDANHQYPGSIQRLFLLQNCLRRKSPLSWNFSKTFLACKIVLDANHQYPEIIQRFFHWQIVLGANHHYPLSWKYSKTFSPAKFS